MSNVDRMMLLRIVEGLSDAVSKILAEVSPKDGANQLAVNLAAAKAIQEVQKAIQAALRD